MSEDELLVLLVSLLVSLVAWLWWYAAIFRWSASMRKQRTAEGLLVGAPVVASLLLFVVLRGYAADDVRYDGRYLGLYTLMGIAWVGIGTFVPPWLGISFRHDVLARKNRAAAWTYAGWIVAVVLAFAGGNIGNGPGWYVVVYCGALATGGLLAVFAIWQRVTGASDAITIDRDPATAARMVGLLVGCGAVFGISVAGDWQSVGATTRDFLLSAWPVVVLFLVALAYDRLYQPTRERPRPSLLVGGVMPLVIMCVMAGVWVAYVGNRASGGPP